MPKTTSHRPAEFWFSLLINAIRDGEFHSAHRAYCELQDAGIDVSFRRLIPEATPEMVRLFQEISSDA
jgi:hypothetical protein